MNSTNTATYYPIVVIGGGQAGLATGYHLAKAGHEFVILDASERIGDSWRQRWDSLKLFTPAKYSSLPGLKFPAPANSFPSKDDMGDYLETYALHFKLPVQSATKVASLTRTGNRYRIVTNQGEMEADQVVVAMSNYQFPKVPAFARNLDPGIVQIHSHEYRNPQQLQEGPVLVVGAGNSGAELALEAASNGHKVWLAGRDTGHIPFNIESWIAKTIFIWLVIRFLFYRVLTTGTFVGRKARPKIISVGGPLIRHKPKQFPRAGIQRIGRITGVKEGQPLYGNNKMLEVSNVIWCTGYYPRFSWIDLPVFQNDQPRQDRGVVLGEPGLYFVGLHFLFALSSAMIHGVGRDAKYIAGIITQRTRSAAAA